MLAIDLAEEREARRGSDFCSKRGAAELQRRIDAYWEAQGGYAPIQFELRDSGFLPAMRSARTDLRSNMIGGWPKRLLSQECAA